MGVNYFHAIKPGSIFTTDKALEKIFPSVDGLTVYNVDEDGEQEEHRTKKELSSRFYNFNNWIIKDSSGSDITKKREIFFLSTYRTYQIILLRKHAMGFDIYWEGACSADKIMELHRWA